jgi:hypothetical protein
MAISETSLLEFSACNISTANLAGGSVEIHLELGSVIVPKAYTEFAAAQGVLRIPLSVDARSSNDIVVPVELGVDAQLFQRYPWRAMLVYNGKVIELLEGYIRMAPIFLPNQNADRSSDLLMITSAKLTREEYVAFDRIFKLLRLNVDYFDVEKYGGISGTNPTWRGRYQGAIVLLPHADDYLALLSAEDTLIHFFDSGYDVVLAEQRGLFSESALILCDVSQATLKSAFIERLWNAATPLRFLGGDFSGSRLIGPGDETDARKAASKVSGGH